MNQRDWKALLTTASDLGPGYSEMLEELGVTGVKSLRTMAERRFGVKYSDVELTLAVYRYQSSMMDQEFQSLDQEKLLRLYFVLYTNQDRTTRSLSASVERMGDVSSEGQIYLDDLAEKKNAWLESEFDFTPIADGLESLEEAYHKKEYENVQAGWKTILKHTELLNETFITQWPILKEKALEAITLAEDHVALMYGDVGVDKAVNDQMRKNADNNAKEINSVEQELGLKAKRGDASPAVYMRRVFMKVTNYRKSHPTEFMWPCPNPECDWEGIMARKRPTEGKSVNALDLHWTWKCPKCKKMVAFDQKHPYFTGSLLFSEIMWNDLCKGELKLEAAARYLETSLENILFNAQTLRLEVPPHLTKELKDYEENYSRPDTDANEL